MSSKNIKILKNFDRDVSAFLIVTMVIFLPFIKPGYIQTIDMAWGPRIPLPAVSDNSYIFVGILHVLSLVVGSMVVQKLLLLGIFVVAGYGAHRLCKLSPLLANIPAAAWLGGIFYIFNPFVYSRLMEGQWLVLSGYALLPWAIASFWCFLQQSSWQSGARASAWAILVGLASIHSVGFLAVTFIGLIVAHGRSNLYRYMRYLPAMLVAWMLANSLWLLPIARGTSHTTLAISGFGNSQLIAFRTIGTIHGSVPLSSLLLEGFWPDLQGRYKLPSELGIYWWFVVGLLAVGILIGIYRVLRARDRLGIVLLALGVIAWWLAMGIGWHLSAGTTHWLIEHVPFYRGYREPQKWLMLLALSYSYFLAIGTASVLQLIRNLDWRQMALGSIALLPVLYTPLLLWGAGGQLVSAQFPADWSRAAQTLDHDSDSYKVLVLPWHQYLPLSFTKRVVGNPVSHYFKQPLITSDNPELKGVAPSENSPLYTLLDDQLLPHANGRTDAAAQLAPYNVKYVLLFKEADWYSYGWVSRQTGWRLVQDSAHLQLYEVRVPN